MLKQFKGNDLISCKVLPNCFLPNKKRWEPNNIPSEFSWYVKTVWRKDSKICPTSMKIGNVQKPLFPLGWSPIWTSVDDPWLPRSHRRPSAKRANRPANPERDQRDPMQRWMWRRNWECSLNCVAVTSYAPCSDTPGCHCLSIMKIQLNLLVRHHWQLVASLGINARIDSYMLLQGQVLSLRPDGMLYFSTRPLLCSETVDWKGLVGHVGLGILFRRFAPQDWVPFKRYTKLYWRNEKRFWFHTILENGFSLIPAQDMAWCCQCSRRELGRRHGSRACFRLRGVDCLGEDSTEMRSK